jgi:hypothetical protein
MITRRFSQLISSVCVVMISVWFGGCSNSTGTGNGGGSAGFLTVGSIFVWQNQDFDSAWHSSGFSIDSLRVANTNGVVGGKYGCYLLQRFFDTYVEDSQWYHPEADGDLSEYVSQAPVPFTWMTYPFNTRSQISVTWDTSGFSNGGYVTENVAMTTSYVGISELPVGASFLSVETVRSVLIVTINSQTEPGVIYDTTFISYSPALGVVVAKDTRQKENYTQNGLREQYYYRTASSLVSYRLAK